MKLRTKKSHFQILPEGEPPKRVLPRIMKFAYYLLLLAIVGGVCFILLMRYMYFTGRGQVEIGKVKISSEHGGKIKAIERKVGDTFLPGDILAVVDLRRDCLKITPDIRLTRLDFVIQEKQSQYDLYTARLKELDAEQKTEILHRALEIGDAASRRRNEEVVREVYRLREKTGLLAAEISIKKEELAILEQELLVTQDPTCDVETIRSSFAGSVYHVTRRPDEYIKKGEPLFMVIPEGEGVVVEAFFDRKDLRYISTGGKMTIQFPDKYTSVGEITNYYSVAKASPDRNKKDYLPVEAKLRVNLKPTTKDDRNHWQLYDRMDVKVKGERK